MARFLLLSVSAACCILGISAQTNNGVDVDQSLQQILVTYVPMIALEPPGFVDFVQRKLGDYAPTELIDFANSMTEEDTQQLVKINQTNLFAARTWPQLLSLLRSEAPSFARRLNALVALENAKFTQLDADTKGEITSTLLGLASLLQQADPSNSIAYQLGQKLGLYFSNNPDAYDTVSNLWSLGER